MSPIIDDGQASRDLYTEVLKIKFKGENDGYLQTEALIGTKSFALWPLRRAAKSCFATDFWPDEMPRPQARLEFAVENVEDATRELESKGYRMLVKNKMEPWGQTVS